MNDQHQARVRGKIYFSGEILFVNSFVSIGSGQGSENSENLLYRDSTGRLIIPASSFAGVLRHQLEEIFAYDKIELEELFGNTHEKRKKCSDIVFTDLYSDQEIEPVVQQGVKINRKYLAAENKGKYDREISLNRRFFFFFYIEKTYQNPEKFYEKWKKRLSYLFHRENPFFIGGRSSVGNGWGRFHNVTFTDYDFTSPGKLKEFLLRKGSEKEFIQEIIKEGNHALPEVEIDMNNSSILLRLDYTITFQDAFLINDPEAEPDDNEAEFNFLIINGRYTIPGSSIKGVFRSRSEMIAETIKMAGNIEDVYGLRPEEPKKEAMKKSSIYFSYTFVQEETPGKKMMTSVSIDRFTGGAADASLFDFNVLMNGTFNGSIILEISEHTLWYLPLLYLVIRDIRDQDLSFGFGRTKGWGKASAFKYSIKTTHLPDKWAIYLKNKEFNLEELENLHKKNLIGVTP
jgi:CRISPR/Cas system CSM-associated protein Csm3 (group 7 of RAMP superfamily)